MSTLPHQLTLLNCGYGCGCVSNGLIQLMGPKVPGEIRMYYEYISLGCGKCEPHLFIASLQNTTMHTGFL